LPVAEGTRNFCTGDILQSYTRCVLQYSGNDEEARDILQEGFIKIFENLHHYKHEGSFEGWMRRITVNTALEKFRTRHSLYRVDDIDTIQEPDAEPDNQDYAGLELMICSKLSENCLRNTEWCLTYMQLKDILIKRLVK